MTFGTKLIQFRKNKKLSQRDVADYIGVSQTAYSEWEADKVSFQVKFLSKLAEIFEVHPSEIIEGKKEEKGKNKLPQTNHNNAATEMETNKNYSRDFYMELIKTKDELIQLLKEENQSLKLKNKKQ